MMFFLKRFNCSGSNQIKSKKNNNKSGSILFIRGIIRGIHL